MKRRTGFTLIELLVVIAIIGILAAMLFPVFARARESARKTQCLANVKNIAIAVNLYLTEWDRFTPFEHRSEVTQWYLDNGVATCDSGVRCKLNSDNPYLKHPVILDDYTKNRDIWRCPSAKFQANVGINWGYGRGDWFRYMVDMAGTDGCIGSIGPGSGNAYPPGWGGETTDSFLESNCASGNNMFTQSIAIPWTLNEMSTSTMNDSAKQVAVADAGVITQQLDRTSWAAYPDSCRIDHDLCDEACGGDWTNCSWSQPCSPLAIDHGGNGHIATDSNARKNELGSRHLGGSNLGFADGHAKWFPSEAILFGGENWSGFATEPTQLYGLGCCFDPTNAPHP
jgi:prepilin-type N-terminal cleavage/methylation domain-containing protein/prepilin-type processing-associated H-X9-DG protein